MLLLSQNPDFKSSFVLAGKTNRRSRNTEAVRRSRDSRASASTDLNARESETE
ncbi:hypothetical protein LEP1GSC050_2159 [Leptospira broomii serovar Hurstbridge str. 5399]|uniref:Uncharacterized protein n=1 Tax=Leptospira broomii serovar Hurstbridge str. 5399 TaxID=1049789 RepID=T0GC45_9LEPT|nr:hypothetical protein LEP1GSC050_2159 [Leptospira broomii serovar Hurstbridge str. 5399]